MTLLVLKSSGGTLAVAFEIARFLRSSAIETEANVSVVVPQGSRCESACALVFAAGPTKYNRGVVGLHRPYFTEFQGDSLRQKVTEIRRRLESFAEEFGLSSRFVDYMTVVEPNEIERFRGEEIFRLVPKNDPVVEAYRVERVARFHGTTPGVMRQRIAKAERVCGETPPSTEEPALTRWGTCQRAIEWGVSPSTYRSRKSAIDACRKNYHDRYQRLGSCIEQVLRK